MDELATPPGSAVRLDLNVQLPDGAVSAESVREQLRMLARLGYGGAAIARPITRRLTRKDVSTSAIISVCSVVYQSASVKTRCAK